MSEISFGYLVLGGDDNYEKSFNYPNTILATFNSGEEAEAEAFARGYVKGGGTMMWAVVLKLFENPETRQLDHYQVSQYS